MLSSDRLRTSHADDHDESDLWERLRSEANRRSSMIPASSSEPPRARFHSMVAPKGQHEDYRAAFDSDPEEYAGESDFPESPHESAQQLARASYVGEHAQYDEYAQQDEGYDQDQTQEQYDLEQQQAAEYAQSEYEAQQYAHQQYGLSQLAPPAPQQFDQAQQYAATEPQYGQRPSRHSYPGAQLPQDHYAQVAAYGHVQQESYAAPAQQQWAPQPAQAPAALASESDETGSLRSRWTRPLAALGALALIGAAGYQFVLVPRQQQARAAALVELQARQAVLIEQQEREQREAAARAEAEQKAANEAALARAEEAAAAASAGAPAEAPSAKAGGSKAESEVGESRSERKARERAERHERRAAARAAKADKVEKAPKSESRSAKSEVASTKPKKKNEGGAMAETDNDDPLLGL